MPRPLPPSALLLIIAAMAGLVDTKIAGRTPDFSGDAVHWEEWSFKFVTWMGLLGTPAEGQRITAQLDAISQEPGVVAEIGVMSEGVQNQARTLS